MEIFAREFSMNNDVDFQIVCVDCGCLAIRIEDPLKASREAIIYAAIAVFHAGPWAPCETSPSSRTRLSNFRRDRWRLAKADAQWTSRSPAMKFQGDITNCDVFAGRSKLPNRSH